MMIIRGIIHADTPCIGIAIGLPFGRRPLVPDEQKQEERPTVIVLALNC